MGKVPYNEQRRDRIHAAQERVDDAVKRGVGAAAVDVAVARGAFDEHGITMPGRIRPIRLGRSGLNSKRTDKS